MDESYEQRVKSHRQEREQFFANSTHSPIPPGRQDEFAGLTHFPIDRKYRYELELDEHDERESFTIETSTGGTQTYIRWGEFRFELGGEERSLQAYKSDPHEERLWVPFRDETNGEETYGAGRYLDLHGQSHRTQDGNWILDFNEAYNPTCAYNEAYECPLIPMENWLDVSIEAGEKDYQGEPIEPTAHHDHHHA